MFVKVVGVVVVKMIVVKNKFEMEIERFLVWIGVGKILVVYIYDVVL